MYTASSGSTKSTIQALLRSREEQQNRSDSIEGPKYCSTPVEEPNGNSQEEYQRDFSYSQKLFHIADGNLYSIFSPIQGRSYGMKPSFLRKHQYTVQECHNSTRGRKNMRRGLKFHNFLPSESVTSEKDDSSKWRRVHSECRLREEHGTKQITISNWSHSSPDNDTVFRNSLPGMNNNESSSTEEDSKPSVHHDPYDFNQCLQQNQAPSPESSFPNFAKVRSTPKKYSLNSVLNSLKEKSPTSDQRSRMDEDADVDVQNRSLPKHRRKPVQTRRVVPYVKYLSMMEENESLPLDLSSKCLIEEDSASSCGKQHCPSPNENFFSPVVPNERNGDKMMMPTQMNAPVTVLYPLPPQQQHGHPSTGARADGQSVEGKSSMFGVHKSLVRGAPTKRRNQRSAMKQRLEDTFRQNGFLVKTKQVSDGDATFCKFRQLRKYTRYYLKSLEQHLPDEFHKMWKGFLPPKTVLPIPAPTPE